ncbi:MAG: hypothetical protein K0U29_08275, partial [Gammaproteobacteria bacterium]|nr:hypothetical protein [Gammaproteobacteria bacterium]
MPDQLETLIQQVTLQQLQSSLVLQRLKMKPLEGQTTLRQRTIHAYKAHVLTALDEILSTEGQKPAVLLARLQRFLADNWRLIKGSMLSYTALPTDEITELLCDVANIVAQQSAEAAAINLLMPDIVTDSAGEVMPDGSRFFDLDQCDIKQVLKTHIELFEGKYLCPVAMLLQTYPINA